MTSSCCLPMILFFFAVNALMVNGAIWNRNLNTFFCGKWSPLEEPFISNTAPPVAITHIFCGQIKVYHGPNGDQVSSEGFHSRPGNKNPRSAIIDATNNQIWTLGDSVQHCPYRVRAMDVKVLDAKWGSWIPRDLDPNRRFIFFPPSWRKHAVVQHIVGVFHTCTNGQQNPNCHRYSDANNRLTQICMRNYNYQGCSNHNLAFRIYLSWQGNGYLVVTAFPDDNCH